jgi:LPS-assembly protein
LDLFSEASRAFTVDFLGFDRIQHRLRPQVTYEYLPEVDQDEYPRFDALDRIEPKNLVTYALVNTFTSRRKTNGVATAAPEGEDLRSAYREFGRLKLEQSYDIREQRADDPEDYADGEHRRPFSPVRLELDLFPGRYVSLSAETEYSTYENSFLAHSLGAGLEDDRGDTLTVDYNYRKGGLIAWQDRADFLEALPQETIAAATLVKLTEKIFVDAQYERNIEESKTTRTLVGVLFRQQCWSIKAGYESDEGDSQFAFSVLLHGLGEFGQAF